MLQRKNLPQLFIRVILTIIVTFISLEFLVRGLGKFDQDGTFYFQSIPIRPYRLPVSAFKNALKQYEPYENSSYIMYDQWLGWSPRPDSVSKDGLYHINSQGLRGNREYSQPPKNGILRVALFGDSYVFGDELHDNESFGPQLEKALLRRGVKAEVLNFGVQGYGFDQAYLRYLHSGKKFNPDIVIQGFFFDDFDRDVNLFPMLHWLAQGDKVSFPMSKPRFSLQKGKLIPINEPTMPLEQIPATLAHFDSSPLRDYEYYYQPEYNALRWYQKSKFLAVGVDLIKRTSRAYFQKRWVLPPESIPLSIAILARFRDEVVHSGGDFELVYLPYKTQIGLLLTKETPLFDESVLAKINSFDPIEPQYVLAQAARISSLESLFRREHYSPKAVRIASEIIADRLVKKIAQKKLDLRQGIK